MEQAGYSRDKHSLLAHIGGSVGCRRKRLSTEEKINSQTRAHGSRPRPATITAARRVGKHCVAIRRAARQDSKRDIVQRGKLICDASRMSERCDLKAWNTER